MSVQNDGLDMFIAEVQRRGGAATRRKGSESLIDIQTPDKGAYVVKLKTKGGKDWRASKSDRHTRSHNPIDAWAFVDIRRGLEDAPIVEAEWLRTDIDRRVAAWLAADSSRSAELDDHCAIEEFRVAEWAGRWDLLGLSGSAAHQARISDDNLGAWVFKCNPKVWKIAEFIADGNDWIEDWSVVENYRSAMIGDGQRAILWVSGPETGSTPRGIWGLGWTVGARYPVVDTSGDYWANPERQAAVDWFVPTDILVLDEPIRAAEVRGHHPDLQQLEVFRSPQQSNPSWISKRELALLQDLLPEWPDRDALAGGTITIGSAGAGYGNPVTNKIVEEAAVAKVTAHYEALGYSVEDVGSQKLGWDLTCSSRIGGLRRVEVKGVAGQNPSILLTRNELRSACEDKYWELAIVTSALTDPSLAIYTADNVIEHAEGYVYQVDLGDTKPKDDGDQSNTP